MLESKALNHEHIYLRQGIGFLFDNDIRMRQHKFFVIKRDMSDNAQPVGDNAKFEDIAKCPLIYSCLISELAEAWEGMEP